MCHFEGGARICVRLTKKSGNWQDSAKTSFTVTWHVQNWHAVALSQTSFVRNRPANVVSYSLPTRDSNHSKGNLYCVTSRQTALSKHHSRQNKKIHLFLRRSTLMTSQMSFLITSPKNVDMTRMKDYDPRASNNEKESGQFSQNQPKKLNTKAPSCPHVTNCTAKVISCAKLSHVIRFLRESWEMKSQWTCTHIYITHPHTPTYNTHAQTHPPTNVRTHMLHPPKYDGFFGRRLAVRASLCGARTIEVTHAFLRQVSEVAVGTAWPTGSLVTTAHQPHRCLLALCSLHSLIRQSYHAIVYSKPLNCIL